MLLSTQTDVVFRTLGEKDGIDVLARAGYDAIDFSMFPMSHDACPLNTCDIELYAKNLRKMAEDAGLVFNQAHAPFPGWRVGDDISKLTRAGKVPSWSTVRQRSWKNEALTNFEKYSPENLMCMSHGRAPLIAHPVTKKIYPMELHHPNGRAGDNLFNFIEVTPWEHDRLDSHRHFRP